jgi:hypothetical protein
MGVAGVTAGMGNCNMVRLGFFLAVTAALLVTSGANAQSRLPEILQKAAEARAGVGADKAGAKQSPWQVEHYGDLPGKGCMLYYVDGEQLMIIAGPHEGGIITDDSNEAIAMMLGPNVPLPKNGQMHYQKVTVKNEGDPDRSVKALIAPNLTGDDKGGTIILYMKTIEEMLGRLKDAQTLGIDIDKKPVVNLRWTGAMTQLNKLRDCVSGKTS